MSDIKLNDIKDILNGPDFFVLGHGTNADENDIKNIFKIGLRTKDNSLYYTTIGLETDNLEELEEYLQNWPHVDAKSIILLRLPIEFINRLGNTADLEGERFGAFFDEHIDETTGKSTFYASPKFIIGCYDANKRVVAMNPSFENELTKETLDELKRKHDKVVQGTYDKFRRQRETTLLPINSAIGPTFYSSINYSVTPGSSSLDLDDDWGEYPTDKSKQ